MQAQAESSNIIIEAKLRRTITMVDAEKGPQFHRGDRRRNFDRAKIESDGFRYQVSFVFEQDP